MKRVFYASHAQHELPLHDALDCAPMKKSRDNKSQSSHLHLLRFIMFIMPTLFANVSLFTSTLSFSPIFSYDDPCITFYSSVLFLCTDSFMMVLLRETIKTHLSYHSSHVPSFFSQDFYFISLSLFLHTQLLSWPLEAA